MNNLLAVACSAKPEYVNKLPVPVHHYGGNAGELGEWNGEEIFDSASLWTG